MSPIPDLWHPETVYLNTASFGLPPDPVWDALQTAQADWRAGRVSWEHWTAVTGRARAQYATLVGADVDRVAVGATVSGLIAPEGTWLARRSETQSCSSRPVSANACRNSAFKVFSVWPSSWGPKVAVIVVLHIVGVANDMTNSLVCPTIALA